MRHPQFKTQCPHGWGLDPAAPSPPTRCGWQNAIQQSGLVELATSILPLVMAQGPPPSGRRLG